MVSTLRLRALCTVDRTRGELVVNERSYFSTWEQRVPLEQLDAVHLIASKPTGPPGTVRSYLLGVSIPDGMYVVAESFSAAALEAQGRVLAGFLGVPLERTTLPDVAASAGRRRLFIAVLLYAAPVTAAVALLGLSIPEEGSSWVVSTTLAAIVLSQVGAILALLYYRRRAHQAPRSQRAPVVPVSEADRVS
jgi:hypothetical protein